jgi:hypothetical protein
MRAELGHRRAELRHERAAMTRAAACARRKDAGWLDAVAPARRSDDDHSVAAGGALG